MMNRRVFFTLGGLALVSGGLIWKYGLESAIAAHFNYDMVLFYGIAPVL